LDWIRDYLCESRVHTYTSMGADDFTEFQAPPQPKAKGVANPYAEAAYASVGGRGGGVGPSSKTISENALGYASALGNAFALYDDALDDGGAESGRWESEATGTRTEARPWQPRYYAMYFDINASDLGARLARSLVPVKPLLGWQQLDEESEGGTSMPDLYGPVWVTTTLVLALSMGSAFSEFLQNVFKRREINRQTLTMSEVHRIWRAGGILYGYVFVFPLALALFQCLFTHKRQPSQSDQIAGVHSHPIFGSIMVYGYAMTPVVVAAWVATIPIEMVQIIAIGVSFAIGACTIVLNLWRDLPEEHRKMTYIVRGVAALTHAGVGAALVYIFYLHRQ